MVEAAEEVVVVVTVVVVGELVEVAVVIEGVVKEAVTSLSMSLGMKRWKILLICMKM